MDDKTVMPKWHQTFAFKLTLCASVMLGTVALVLSAVAFDIAQEIVREEVHQQLTTTTVDRQKMISAYVFQQHERVKLVASRTRLRAIIDDYVVGSMRSDAMQDATGPIFSDVLSGSDGFLNVSICDLDGTVITSTDAGIVGQDLSGRPAFARGQKGPFLDDPRPIEGSYLALLSGPIHSHDGRLLGVVVVQLDAKPLWEVVTDRNGLGATGQVLVASRDGDDVRYLNPTFDGGALSPSLHAFPAMDRALNGESSDRVLETTHAGRDVLAAYIPANFGSHDQHRWGVMAQVDAAEAYEPVNILARQMAAVAAGLLLLGVGISMFLAARAVRPLKVLSAAAREIAAGNQDARATVSSGDEFGMLASAFNGMADKIAAAQATLEETVEQRTTELAKSEEKFRALFESSRDAVIILDEGQIADCNQSAVKLFGCDGVADLVGRHPAGLSPITQPCGRTSEELAKEYIERAFGEGCHLFDWTHRRVDGTEFFAEVLLSAIDGPSQGTAQATIRDITDRHDANEALVRSEERFQLAMRGSTDGLWDWNLETNEIYFSPRWKKMLGYAEDEIEPHLDAALALIHADDKQHVLETIERYFSGESTKFEVEVRMRHKDGRYIHILSRGFAVWRDGEDRPYRMVGTHADVSERKQRIEQLNQLKTTLDQTDDCVFIFRPETLQFYYVNRGAIQQVGYSADELMQMTPLDIKPEFTEAAFRQLVEPLLHGEQDSLRFETVHRHKDGHDIPVEVSLQYVAPHREPPRFVAVVRDITKRKEAESQVAIRSRVSSLAADVGMELARDESVRTGLQSCCRSVVEHLDAAFARIWTVDGTEANLELQASAGLYTHIDGDHARIPIGKATIGRIAQARKPYLTNDVPHDPNVSDPAWACRESMVAFAGYPLIVGERVVGVLALFSRTPLAAETMEGLAVIADTIALFVDRKRNERQLHESYQEITKLSLVASKTQHSVVISDPQGRIEWVNEAFTRLTGYAAHEVIGRRPGELLQGPETDAATVARIGDRLRCRKSVAAAIVNYGKSGNKYWIDLKIDPVFNSEGELTNFIATQIDITERKESERALIATRDEAERANRAKSEFLASMSHELRTPLNGVIGMTELLADTDLDSRQRRFVSACQSSGQSLLTLINDILDLSKIEAGRLELDKHPFDLLQLLDDVMETMPLRLGEKNVELLYNLAHPTTLHLLGDSHRLRQVLVNLLGNAIKFTEQGEIHLRAQPQRLHDDKATILFSVEDTGIGIPQNRMNRLFESFSQVDSSTSRKYGGSGLGLSISKALVEAMGGQIGVESTEGVGSRFWFNASFARTEQSDRATRMLLEDIKSLRVLIVEQHDASRDLLVEFVRGWGMFVEAVAAEDQTLRLIGDAAAANEPFDLVILSENSAAGGDDSLAKQIRNHSEYRGLGIFLITAMDSDTEMPTGVADACLRKPVGQSRLLDAIVDRFCRHRDNGSTTINTSNGPQETNRPVGTKPVKVLLAEDNETNRLFAKEILTRNGWECAIACNGIEAVDAVQDGDFDLVLMDCHMPEMDGFSATEEIRNRESDGRLDGHIPIVALTANAIKGDRERCLDAGMDDYVPKPFKPTELTAVVARLLQNKDSHPSDVLSSDHSDHAQGESPRIDQNELFERCMGDLSFAESLLESFERDSSARLEEIVKLAGSGNALAAAEAAHGLKGIAGIVAAHPLQELAAKIESVGKAGDLEDVVRLIDDLRREVNGCLADVPRIRRQLQETK